MAQLKQIYFVKMMGVVNIYDEEITDDWRNNYVDKIGMLEIYESENLHPGMPFIKFLPQTEFEIQTYFQTTCGQLKTEQNLIRFITEEWEYIFDTTDSEIVEIDKELLILNEFFR